MAERWYLSIKWISELRGIWSVSPSRCRVCRWLVRCCDVGCVHIYDSAYSTISLRTKKLILTFLKPALDYTKFRLVKMPLQTNGNDCGLYAIASATELAFRRTNPFLFHVKWDRRQMRSHLLKCLDDKKWNASPKFWMAKLYTLGLPILSSTIKKKSCIACAEVQMTWESLWFSATNVKSGFTKHAWTLIWIRTWEVIHGIATLAHIDVSQILPFFVGHNFIFVSCGFYCLTLL